MAFQEYDTKHGVTIVKSIVEGTNYRYDDGSNTKELIKELKLLPRSVKEASVRLNHFGKDFIRVNISRTKHANHTVSPSSPDRSPHSHHLHTTHAADSPSKYFPAKNPSPTSPSQLDPFLSLIPPHRQAHAREAAQLFNSSITHTSNFRARHDGSKAESPLQLQQESGSKMPPPLLLTADSRPVTSASASCSNLPMRASQNIDSRVQARTFSPDTSQDSPAGSGLKFISGLFRVFAGPFGGTAHA